MKTIQSAGGLFWVNEGSRIHVIAETGEDSHLLRGEEAALWRWLHQSFSWSEIQALFSALTDLAPEEAAGRMAEILRKWFKKGLIEVCDG